LLVFKLLKKLGLKSAYLLAFIYAIHPMNVEAVAWIFQAKTNLANVFGLTCFIFWINFVQTSCSSKKYYFLTIVFLTFSFLSKISLVLLPITMLIYINYFEAKMSLLKKILVTLPFFVTSFIVGLINIHWDLNTYQVPPSEMILDPNILFRFALVGHTYLFYIIKTFLPWPLMFVHPKFILNLDHISTFFPSITLAFFIFYIAYKILTRLKVSLLEIGFLISFLILLPVLGITEIYFMRFSFIAEHWLTIGMVGFLAGVVEYLYVKNFLKFFIFIFIISCGYITFNYIQEYSSQKALMEFSLSKNENSFLSHNILGLIYKHDNKPTEAIEHFQKSIKIHPNAQGYFNMASTQESLKQINIAKYNYLKAIELNPYMPISYFNLGSLYARLNDYKLAMDYFQMALQRDPYDSDTYYNIGYMYEITNQKTEAVIWFKKARLLKPENELYLKAIQRQGP
jgi:tetratricopeptide (TPR) repeat protein